MVMCFAVLAGCSKDLDFGDYGKVGSDEYVGTGVHGEPTETSVTLYGCFNKDKIGSDILSCKFGFILHTDRNGIDKDGCRVQAESVNDGTYEVSVNNLRPSTTYYYCAYIKTAGGMSITSSEVREFTTRSMVIQAGEAENISFDEADIPVVVDDSQAGWASELGIIYSEWSDVSLANCKERISVKGSGNVHISSLYVGALYYYREYAITENDDVYGDVKSFTTKEFSLNQSGAVDLGLSVKWAACNIGANSPEEYGDYYAWGETATKSKYTSSNCKWDMPNGSLQNQGVIDENGNLTAQYDAATQRLGGKWRMPTATEQQELIDNCIWRKHKSGGYYVSSKTNGNTIFLPAAGHRYEAELSEAGAKGFYWSSTASELTYVNASYYMGLFSNGPGWQVLGRFNGHSIRPVSD